MTHARAPISDMARYHAVKLWEIGVELLLNSHIQGAIDTFSESIETHPTAEAYTMRGWGHSLLGGYNMAIVDCRRAIKLDPDFGNPYNDLGVYLMQMGCLDEAMCWFEQAKEAKRYKPRQFAYLNAGHLFMIRGDEARALGEYVRALELDPGNEAAQNAIANMTLRF